MLCMTTVKLTPHQFWRPWKFLTPLSWMSGILVSGRRGWSRGRASSPTIMEMSSLWVHPMRVWEDGDDDVDRQGPYVAGNRHGAGELVKADGEVIGIVLIFISTIALVIISTIVLAIISSTTTRCMNSEYYRWGQRSTRRENLSSSPSPRRKLPELKTIKLNKFKLKKKQLQNLRLE